MLGLLPNPPRLYKRILPWQGKDPFAPQRSSNVAAGLPVLTITRLGKYLRQLLSAYQHWQVWIPRTQTATTSSWHFDDMSLETLVPQDTVVGTFTAGRADKRTFCEEALIKHSWRLEITFSPPKYLFQGFCEFRRQQPR
jgi:hypothetical protein